MSNLSQTTFCFIFPKDLIYPYNTGFLSFSSDIDDDDDDDDNDDDDNRLD